LLIGPTGEETLLFENVGGCNESFEDTLLDDQAEKAFDDLTADAPFTGGFRPKGPLSHFVGISAEGTWTLRIIDYATPDAGALVNWSLIFEGNCPKGPFQ
jgi:hypothetical protein